MLTDDERWAFQRGYAHGVRAAIKAHAERKEGDERVFGIERVLDEFVAAIRGECSDSFDEALRMFEHGEAARQGA